MIPTADGQSDDANNVDKGPIEEERAYASLSDALRAAKVPVENDAFIAQLMVAVGISAYFGKSGYVRADRVDGRQSLHISYGWTNGFLSEDEVRDAVDSYLLSGRGAGPWLSPSRSKLWGVTHPVSGSGRGPETTAGKVRRDYGSCQTCFTAFSANHTCTCDI